MRHPATASFFRRITSLFLDKVDNVDNFDLVETYLVLHLIREVLPLSYTSSAITKNTGQSEYWSEV